jgi:hypothetical protein
MLLALDGIEPIGAAHVFGRQHPLARLQSDAMFALKPFENFLGLLPPTGNNFWQLFQQGFGHAAKAVIWELGRYENRTFSLLKVKAALSLPSMLSMVGMSIEKAEFSKRLKAAIREKKWDDRPAALEKKFNTRYEGNSVSFQTVSAWLGGRAIPQQDKLRVLADMLGIEPQHLRFGDQTPPKSRAKQAGWVGPLNDHDHNTVKALLSLPASRRRLVSDLIKELAAD